jgi:hypothetical protein
MGSLLQAHEGSERFNPGWLEDENEKVLVELLGNCVTPLCSQPGRVALTATRIYFQPFNVASNSPVQTYLLNKARLCRQYENVRLQSSFSENLYTVLGISPNFLRRSCENLRNPHLRVPRKLSKYLE